ncbi:MAG: 5-formyltetrahydrofolate cyclo-ligase [Panacagrimonas sp.]
MNSIAAQKAQLRRQLRAARAALSKSTRQSKSNRAARSLLRSNALRRAQHIAVYLDTGSEIQTAALIDALHRNGKQVLVPATDSRIAGRMSLVCLRQNATLVARQFGIRAPARTLRVSQCRVDLMILPLIGFDACGHRLGSGAGYYDRWLAHRRPRPYCIGYAYALQQVARIPTEKWDQRLDAVCTERGVRYFSKNIFEPEKTPWPTG